ncbi:MAG TPA: glycosyltransferase family 1 protein [Caulobacteraceae bacterium]|nr:glycosyltransferase family 1 protein [Caulobacteraceae bacterium]
MTKVLFDMSRIFIRGSRFSPTGIDRVVVAYARWLLGRPDIELQPVLTFGGKLYGIPRSMLERTIRQNEAFGRQRNDGAASGAWLALQQALGSAEDPPAPLRPRPASDQIPERVRWHLDIAGRAIANLRPVNTGPGSIYVNVSHTGLDQTQVLGRLARRGVAPLVMVHDLIPIYFPEYCAPKAQGRHLRRMREVIEHARLVITNSQTTADELSAYAAALGRTAPPTRVAPLGIEADFFGRTPDWEAARPYFVCVGTIEARKNLAFLLALWRRLAERLGADAPRLVLVGRRGWENESVIDHLERSQSVRRLVHEVSDLSDRELARLVGGATALLSPSMAEGYDLPVVEALTVKTPVIASDIPVHRELAGGVATLVDPLDGAAWIAAIEAALQRNSRGPAYAAPAWQTHFEQVAEAMRAIGTDAAVRPTG